ncbi:MAG: trypsin-like peptidase domain-containing protein [Candidatus Saccharibacteria bacterium]|nr:trypsin-like peptidase domain-containing protein [Candidatus Saccharibacteria bacterium]
MMKEPKRPGLFGTIRRIILLLIILGVGALIGISSLLAYNYSHTNRSAVTTRQTLSDDGNLVKTSQEDVITSVADKVSPSVVSIVTDVTTQTIFGAATQQAAGTGIVVSKDGYILTNRHVVSSASKVQVVMADGTTHEDVQVVGTDPLNDVAFLKIDGVSDLRAATLGDSSTVRIGQEVIAIGNSLGQYQNTVTSGIISGKGRPVSAGDGSGGSTESLTDLLQTDAAINPGNSGGPLLNVSGQVIGMNTAVAANAQGIGFAIPINATKGTLKSVLAGKGVQRAYLGLRYVPLTAAVAKQYNLSVTEGAYVVGGENSATGVVSEGPADKAGVKDKDIITKINGLTVGRQGGVSSLIGEYAPGDTVELVIVRDGRELTTKVTLAAYPSD